eukprot:GGOE01025657.1.p1 GENE.GGOE01025657.1~~GGOE01025657.1.p1  ORF type:complete len:728 (-),score=153.09 GGOE01025657.1:445-2304(-)
MAKKGFGKLEKLEGTVLTGSGTQFTSQVNPKDCIGWRTPACTDEVTVVVKEVKSDTELLLEQGVPEGHFAGPIEKFRILPKVDHSQMYNAVYDKLKGGHAVGLFPEGGSHDRTSLLPFKSGCAVFALGATKHGCRPVIIPFGLTYFHGHHFRSRAHLEFGEPLYISDEILELYNQNPKAGVKALVAQIEDAVKDITMQFRNYDEMKMIHTMRHLYVPYKVTLVTGEYLRMTRRLAQAYDMLRDNEHIISLAKKIQHYQTLTESFWLIDAQVETIPEMKRLKSDPWLMYFIFVRSLLALFFFCMLAAPGYLLNFPLVAIAKLVAVRQARIALAGSTVKVAGRDVMASYKIITLMSVGPIMFTSIFLFNWWFYSFTYAVSISLFLMMLTYISLYAIPEAILRIKSIIPFFLWMCFKRYRRMFDMLYEERRELEKEVRKTVGALGPTCGERIWSDRTQTIYEIIKEEESNKQAVDDELHGNKYMQMPVPFLNKRRSRLRPPRARDKILFWLNKVLHLNINWDYLAFPELKTGMGSNSTSFDSFDDFVSMGTGLGEPKAWGKLEGDIPMELQEGVSHVVRTQQKLSALKDQVAEACQVDAGSHDPNAEEALRHRIPAVIERSE